MAALRPRIVLVLLASFLLAHAPDARAEEDRVASGVRDAALGLGSPRAADREAALAALEAIAEHDGAPLARAVRALRGLVRRGSPAQAGRAARLLAAVPGPEGLDAWLDALDADAPWPQLAGALEGAARRRADVATIRALVDRARDVRASEPRRALAVEALGGVGGRIARAFLLHPLAGSAEPGETPPPGEGWLLAAMRARGLGRLLDPGQEGVLALLALLEHPDPAPRAHAWEALTGRTGLELPAEAAPWREAWEERERGVPFAPAPAPEPGPAADDPYGTRRPAHVPHYYGVPIDRPRSRVVFCLDVSQSMYGRGIEQARRELERTLRELPATYAFDVIAFHERVRPFAGRLLPAHPIVKHRVLAWLAALETISYTNLYDAVELAFGMGGIGPEAAEGAGRLDAVFLLSDGAPNRGRHRDEDGVVEAIAALSRGRIPVHTVAAGEDVFPLLQRIARRTGGRFVDAFEFD